MSRQVDVLIIGGGPSALACAYQLKDSGLNVLLVDDGITLGGRLNYLMQTQHLAFKRTFNGVDLEKVIATLLSISSFNILNNASCLALYEDGVATIFHNKQYIKVKPQYTVVATGAYEHSMAFLGNTMKGTYGLNAMLKLVKLEGLKSGDKAFLVGPLNLSYTLSNLLINKGVNVVGILEVAPSIGEYGLFNITPSHLKIPVFKDFEISEVLGEKQVEGICLKSLQDGTYQNIICDYISYNEGLMPLVELLWQRGCDMSYQQALGGHIPSLDDAFMSSVDHVLVIGDAKGIGSIEKAVLEGMLAGFHVYNACRGKSKDRYLKIEQLKMDYKTLLIAKEKM